MVILSVEKVKALYGWCIQVLNFQRIQGRENAGPDHWKVTDILFGGGVAYPAEPSGQYSLDILKQANGLGEEQCMYGKSKKKAQRD